MGLAFEPSWLMLIRVEQGYGAEVQSNNLTKSSYIPSMLHDAGKAVTGHLRSYLGQHKGVLTSGTISKKNRTSTSGNSRHIIRILFLIIFHLASLSCLSQIICKCLKWRRPYSLGKILGLYFRYKWYWVDQIKKKSVTLLSTAPRIDMGMLFFGEWRSGMNFYFNDLVG